MDLEQQLSKAATAISNAKALVITAGGGMGVDSGLPDFRGDHGFWNAYPMYRRLLHGTVSGLCCMEQCQVYCMEQCQVYTLTPV